MQLQARLVPSVDIPPWGKCKSKHDAPAEHLLHSALTPADNFPSCSVMSCSVMQRGNELPRPL